MQGRTTLLVTHRLGTVHHLKRILVLSGGTIAEEGSGPDLVARRGIYTGLYEASHRATPDPENIS